MMKVIKVYNSLKNASLLEPVRGWFARATRPITISHNEASSQRDAAKLTF